MHSSKQFLTCQQYFERWYQPADRIAILVRNYMSGAILQRIIRANQAAAPRFQSWIQALDLGGGNVYSSVNVFRSVAGGRTKANIDRVRGVHMEIYHDGDAAVQRLFGDARVPSPNVLIYSSPGRYQLLWKTHDLTVEQAESVNKALAHEFGGDSAATDATRILRVPDLHNWKRTERFTVTAQQLSGKVHCLTDFQLSLGPATAPASPTFARRSIRPQRISQSERDWAMVMTRLSPGEPRDVIQRDLERSRPDKPRPAFYAQLTLDKAVRELQLRNLGPRTPEIEP
jgi:RepB DNA-primase from phage plasmid